MKHTHSSLLALVSLAPLAVAGDWGNAGGNAGRNGSTQELGPEAATLLWSGAKSSIIAWQPVTEGRRVFLVRQSSFIPSGVPNDAPIVALDLDTGAELWSVDLPYNPGEWTTWVAGVRNGRVFASRGGNGASSQAKLYALDAATGGILWDSDDLIDAGAYDGVSFAPDGDAIVASFRDIWRIDATDGSTVWRADRQCSVSGNCGPAVYGDAVYVADATFGGHVLKRFDLATGAFGYESAVMPGFLMQNTPMAGPDGTVYLNRVQNNPGTDFFYAFSDDGVGFAEKWNVAANYNTAVEYAIGPDGDVYMMGPGHMLQRLDPATGAMTGSFALGDSASVRIATDALGRVYVSDGEFATGTFYCLDADLTLRWSTAVTNINIGAPALAEDGTLVVAGVGSDVRAYRNPLAQDVIEISLSTGGAQTLKLHEPGSAGMSYWILGTTSGTAPGLLVGSVLLPLNFDPYTTYTIAQPNGPVLQSSLGTVDPTGDAVCTIQLPPGAPISPLPLTANHAALVLDLSTAVASFASNPTTVRIVP
ncbi:MAG: PQQ-binding-like beta-propeller repeat protein [Planctomycetota bacterium]